jgi:hypothetical protein
LKDSVHEIFRCPAASAWTELLGWLESIEMFWFCAVAAQHLSEGADGDVGDGAEPDPRPPPSAPGFSEAVHEQERHVIAERFPQFPRQEGKKSTVKAL